jgi:hypothetical protein
MSRRDRIRLAFAVTALLAVIGVAGGGAVAGLASLGAEIGLILACAASLHGADETMRRQGERVGLVGLLGRYF